MNENKIPELDVVVAGSDCALYGKNDPRYGGDMVCRERVRVQQVGRYAKRLRGLAFVWQYELVRDGGTKGGVKRLV